MLIARSAFCGEIKRAERTWNSIPKSKPQSCLPLVTTAPVYSVPNTGGENWREAFSSSAFSFLFQWTGHKINATHWCSHTHTHTTSHYRWKHTQLCVMEVIFWIVERSQRNEDVKVMCLSVKLANWKIIWMKRVKKRRREINEWMEKMCMSVLLYASIWYLYYQACMTTVCFYCKVKQISVCAQQIKYEVVSLSRWSLNPHTIYTHVCLTCELVEQDNYPI